MLRAIKKKTSPPNSGPLHPCAPAMHYATPEHLYPQARPGAVLWERCEEHTCLSYEPTHSSTQDRHKTGFLKTWNILMVCMKNPSFNKGIDCMWLNRRILLPETFCSLCRRIVYCSDDLFKSRYTKKKKYIQQQNQQKFTRRDSGWAQTWLTKCK